MEKDSGRVRQRAPGRLKRVTTLDERTLVRLSESFVLIPGFSERERLRVTRCLASAFLDSACLSAAQRRRRLDDFMFNIGEVVGALPRLSQAIEDARQGRPSTLKRAIEDWCWDIANHLQAAAVLYTGWSLIDLAGPPPEICTGDKRSR